MPQTHIQTAPDAMAPASAHATVDDRPLKPAVWRGWRNCCPACGARGAMRKGYLGVRDACPECDEALHHHRADDGPAYLTILIVGHVMAPALMWAFVTYRPDPWVMVGAFSTGTVALSLYLLPRIKGALVALQWSRRMHGFGTPKPA
jgi:uncharacterized protein (DUF983 family)